MNITESALAVSALGGVAEWQASQVEVGCDDNVPSSISDSSLQLLGSCHEDQIRGKRICCHIVLDEACVSASA